MSSPECHYCGTDKELRPYGPGGSWVCYPCVTATPERDAAAGQVFITLIDAAAATTETGVVLVDEQGPRPFDPSWLFDGGPDGDA